MSKKFEETDIKRDLSTQVPKPPEFRRLKVNEEANKDVIEYLDRVTGPFNTSTSSGGSSSGSSSSSGGSSSSGSSSGNSSNIATDKEVDDVIAEVFG